MIRLDYPQQTTNARYIKGYNYTAAIHRMDIRMQARVYQPGGPRVVSFIMHVPESEIDEYLPSISPEQLEQVLNASLHDDVSGPAVPKLPLEVLDEVAPRYRYKHPPNSTNDEQCSVCFDTYTSRTRRFVRRLACGHQFCSGCIEKWVTKHSATCPVCRHAITK